ncbi:hypothetical protein BDF20DRAFT_151143 [Mycotypha africana]|uniref:uncharacterized protein n=1 Tax=Mycotypha africana TaxID=64632 RepID=UPI0023017FDB|nr:uncharacterized protein BDF20DRAFT_151143 [Mycotypha africana]KAI8969216.1 hypothetical protein BDF20DRAFT_151143 [Mycotypha africana]
MSCANEILQKKMQEEYFNMVETISVTTSTLDLALLVSIAHLVNQNQYVSISSIMDGLDVLIHRALLISNKISSSDNSSEFYLVKVLILSELCQEAMQLSIDFEERVLGSTMDDIFLIKGDIPDAELSAIQMLLWRTGDGFYDFRTASLWFKYAYNITSSTFGENTNAIIMARKLSVCFIQMEDADAAYESLRKGIEDTAEPAIEDYLLLFQYSLRQTKVEQPYLTDPILATLFECKDLSLKHFLPILKYCYKYGKKGSIMKTVLDGLLLVYDRSLNALIERQEKLDMIHLLVFLIRCTVHIKTTVYDAMKKEGNSRTRKLNFKAIASYFGVVCELIAEVPKDEVQGTVLLSDLEWILHTSWNLGLFCFSQGRHEEGVLMFDNINKCLSSVTS